MLIVDVSGLCLVSCTFLCFRKCFLCLLFSLGRGEGAGRGLLADAGQVVARAFTCRSEDNSGKIVWKIQ